MKPYVHAVNSVSRYGGVWQDYEPIHSWFDSTKAAWADVRHRAILHNTFGIFLAEQIFGKVITNSDGKNISVRDIAEDHVAEDFGGKIPTVEEWFSKIPLEPWMNGRGQKEFQDRDLRLKKED